MAKTLKYILLACVIWLSSCSEYGRRLEFNNGEVFYSKQVRYNEALHTGRLLAKNNMYFDGRPKSVQLDKRDGRYILRVVEPNTNSTKPYQNLAYLLSKDVFHAPVDVELCNERFKSLRQIPYTEVPAE